MKPPIDKNVRRVFKSLELDGTTVHVYLEKFENAYLVLISEDGVKLGTLVCSMKLREGLTHSTTLLGWRSEVEARMLAERLSHETGLITLLSLNLRSETLQKSLQEIAKTLVQSLEEVRG